MNYDKEGEGHQILSWRKGFTLHYLRSQDNPVMIGGNYGNRQESQIMLMLPEVKCSDTPHFKEGSCVPCPVGSIYDKNEKECDWCKPYEFFHEDPEDYFKSECVSCPSGTVGGYENECIPCEAG